ncbi:MAG: choice-of-anchor tandem repeat NxxGxxAF-containing protein, partial [Planctomycetota bacterium]
CLFDGVSTGYLNAIGSFLVELNLVGPEVDSSNDVALISYVDGIQNAVARKGQAHRDLSDGAVFDDFSCIHFNDQNQVLFFAQLTGDAVTEDNDTALFLTDEDGVLRLVVREGDPFNVSNRGGDFRTIDYLGVVDGLGNETGTPRALNNAGEIAFWLRFTDESEAIVKTIIDGQKGPVLGDINLDGLVNLLDVDPFVQLLSLGQFQIEADLNLDGVVNLLDIEPFIDVLSGN